jgi:hypothetical protein
MLCSYVAFVVDLIYFLVSNQNNKSYSDSNIRIILLKEGNHSLSKKKKQRKKEGLCKLFNLLVIELNI